MFSICIVPTIYKSIVLSFFSKSSKNDYVIKLLFKVLVSLRFWKVPTERKGTDKS